MAACHDRRNFLKTGCFLGTGLVFGGVDIGSGGNRSEDLDKLSVFDVIHKRRSVREYQPTPVPEEHIRKILDAARMAPTSGNQQPWKFLVIRDRKKLNM